MGWFDALMTLLRHLECPGVTFMAVGLEKRQPSICLALVPAAAGVVGWRGASAMVLFPMDLCSSACQGWWEQPPGGEQQIQIPSMSGSASSFVSQEEGNCWAGPTGLEIAALDSISRKVVH